MRRVDASTSVQIVQIARFRARLDAMDALDVVTDVVTAEVVNVRAGPGWMPAVCVEAHSNGHERAAAVIS
jgi:hypothetical protein